jgi:hypothetical protein
MCSEIDWLAPFNTVSEEVARDIFAPDALLRWCDLGLSWPCLLTDALIGASLSCTVKWTYVLIVGGHVGTGDHLQVYSDKINVVLLLGSIPGQMVDVHNAFVKFASEFDVE